jgi:hypothetical protein
MLMSPMFVDSIPDEVVSLRLDLIPEKEDPNQICTQLMNLRHKNIGSNSKMTIEGSRTMPIVGPCALYAPLPFSLLINLLSGSIKRIKLCLHLRTFFSGGPGELGGKEICYQICGK